MCGGSPFPVVVVRDVFSWVFTDPKRVRIGGSARCRMFRRGMSDEDLVTECCRLQGLDELSRCEEMRLEIVQDELECRQAGAVSSRRL